MPTALQLLILILGVFRITRLIIEDTILEPVRERTVFRLDPRSKVRELLDCPWCLGFWLSMLAVISWAADPTVTGWVLLPFAISAGVGIIAERS